MAELTFPDKLKHSGLALDSAMAHLQDCEKAAREANTALTAARNRLNDKQKEFDLLVTEAKKSAPRDSDWGASKGLVT